MEKLADDQFIRLSILPTQPMYFLCARLRELRCRSLGIMELVRRKKENFSVGSMERHVTRVIENVQKYTTQCSELRRKRKWVGRIVHAYLILEGSKTLLLYDVKVKEKLKN